MEIRQPEPKLPCAFCLVCMPGQSKTGTQSTLRVNLRQGFKREGGHAITRSGMVLVTEGID
jgi:hypothetical protein